MLKTLAILAVLLAGLPVYGQKESPKTNHEQKPTQAIEQKEPVPPAVSIVNSVGQPAPQGEENNAQNYAEGYLHHLLLPETIASIGLLLAGIAGIRVALRTLKAVEQQANSAKAATDAFVESERSRIFIRRELLKDAELLSFEFFAVNLGRSPAALTYYFVALKVLYGDESLADEPTYGETGEYGLSGNEWILPNADKPYHFATPEETIITKDSDPQQWEAIIHGRGRVWVYGLLRYRDGLSPREYQTGFCYRWIGGKALMPSGPDAYTKCT